MSTYEQKTRPTPQDVDTFLASIEDEQQRSDAMHLRKVMESVSGKDAVLWGSSIVGFGAYYYRYASGHEGDAPAVGFSPRKANMTVYITGGFEDQQDTLERLGKHKLGKGCLYIKRLSDVDESVLQELIQVSVDNAASFHVEAVV